MVVTNYDRVTFDHNSLAWELTRFFVCDPSFCDVCGLEDECPLYGIDWRKQLKEDYALSSIVHRLEAWLKEEAFK